MIYADNAATTELDRSAFDAMQPFLLHQYGNASQPYSFGVKARKALKDARQIIAECIGASPEEVFFTSGGTESDNWAIKMGSVKGKKTITSAIEHHAVLNSCATIAKQGAEVSYLPVNKGGEVDPEELKRIIDKDTGLVSVMFANNEVGTVQRIKDLASIAHQHGALFHTDAVQAIGHVNIDVRELDVDLLSASAHKFNGPKGTGFLYIKKGTELPALFDGGMQENGSRAGTENIASIVGMAVALKKNCASIEENKRQLQEMECMLLEKLNEADIDFIRNGGTHHIPGNISLSFKGKEGEMILHRMDLKGICISTGSACDSVNTEVSHVIKAIGVSDEYAIGTIRISLGKNNTIEEVSVIADALISILK